MVAPSSDPEDVRDYSIFAASGSMYLLLSIAATDLWACLALIFEGRSPYSAAGRPGAAFVWMTRRRAFGFALLGTFLTLVGASIRVLFQLSFENVDVVIGAATVLFVADVVRDKEIARASQCWPTIPSGFVPVPRGTRH